MTDSETLCIHYGADETDLVLQADRYGVHVTMPDEHSKDLSENEVRLVRDFMDRALKRMEIE